MNDLFVRTVTVADIAAAEERGRRSAAEVLELMRQHERVASHVALLMGAIANIEAIAPRDSGKKPPGQPCCRLAPHPGCEGWAP